MSDEFKIRHFDEDATKAFLKGAIRLTNSVPFLGAGFSAGERSRVNPVPFGSEWLRTMRSQILASGSDDKPTEDELGRMSFQDVADVYFFDEFVPLDEVKHTLDSYFSKVVIGNASKLRFLEAEWPYLYTLNIDDGIERSIDAIKILPYRTFSKLPGRRFVYKLHGDIDDLLAAPSHQEMAAIFGKKQYIGGLDKNKAMLADLSNDFAEKNLLFVGCSLSDELHVLFALARAESAPARGKGARIYVCSVAPSGFTDKKKMRDYGITDVVVVPDYSSFYSFLANAISHSDNSSSPLNSYELLDNKGQPRTKANQIRYLIQAGWRGDPYQFCIARHLERVVRAAIEEQSLIVVWGRRFSGRTSFLYRVLNEYKTRQRFFISSSTTISDALFNAILKARNALIAIDSNTLFQTQLRRLAEQHHRISENGTCVVVALGRADLNAFGRDFDYENRVFELDQRLRPKEQTAINGIISPLGYHKWLPGKTILDNVFSLSASAITTATIKDVSVLNTKVHQLCDGWSISETSKLQFMVLYYLTVRHRIPSKLVRELAKARGHGYMGDVLLEEIPRTMQPFVEREPSDPSTRIVDNSDNQLVSNSFAWLRKVVQEVSQRAGPEESASLIVGMYTAVKEIDSNSFELVLFDSLNAVYETSDSTADWRGAVIRRVYEQLGSVLADQADYWLQHAKSIYYISTDPDELRKAAAYCEKGIVERASKKTWSNAQLTRANIYGKLCLLTDYARDDEMLTALLAYQAAIEQSVLNASYIDELLRKSKNGKHYLSRLCGAANGRKGLLPSRAVVRELSSYLNNLS